MKDSVRDTVREKRRGELTAQQRNSHRAVVSTRVKKVMRCSCVLVYARRRTDLKRARQNPKRQKRRTSAALYHVHVSGLSVCVFPLCVNKRKKKGECTLVWTRGVVVVAVAEVQHGERHTQNDGAAARG